jgi:3-oxoacyl-[acyl-carrier protein] reductase
LDLQLLGRRALVTGSRSGIGAGIARLLAQEGAAVVVHGRNKERTLAVAEQLRRAGGVATTVVGDLSTDAGASAVGEAVLAEGAIDILVNNAGGVTTAGNPPWFETPPKAWLDTYSQNVGAAVRLCHAFVPAMKARGWGRIINISSGAGTHPNPFIPDYGASKGAINNLTVGLSKALSGTGITVNTVSPGSILTPALENWLRELARQMNWGDDWAIIEKRYITEMFPLPVPRLGRVEDIAAVVALLASPQGSYITGANLRVDGGHAAAVN